MANRVTFKVNDPKLQRMFDAAEETAKVNIGTIGKYRVMTEGTLLYPNVWPETQPMAGEMYAKRDLEIGVNNCMIFIDHQREDGRLPGMVSQGEGGSVPHYGWMQGFYFAMPALKMYYHADLGETYLKKLYDCLKKFDAYLWKYRDSDGDGCLESWCRWDTGKTNAPVTAMPITPARAKNRPSEKMPCPWNRWIIWGIRTPTAMCSRALRPCCKTGKSKCGAGAPTKYAKR